jgi:hypothetical protein
MPENFDSFLEEALKRFNCAEEAESEIRAKCLDDLKFSTGDQWDATVRTRRERKNKPCLTMDQMQQSTRIVCNQYRQQKPAIEVNPVGDESDIKTAEILQGTIRHIEVNSDADVAYENAHEFVVRIGFGSWRIVSDYADDETEEQEIYIRKIRNPFTVYWQPGVEQEDAKWCFIVQDVPIDTYKEDYQDSELAKMSLELMRSIGDSSPQWLTKEVVRVAEYFTVTETKAKGKRTKKKVKWYKFNAIEILDEQDLPGTSIPVFTAYGDDIDVDGKRYLAGLIRNGKDPQRFRNFMVSAAAQTVLLAPDAPWLTVAGSTSGFESLWNQANTGDVQVLYYNQLDVGGKPAPAPTRNTTEPPIQAVQLLVNQAAQDLKAALGIYDPSLGQRKGDESGKAIERLQQQGSMATLNYSDNMARTMRRCGKLLLEWIRDKYDVPKIRRIINPDGTVSQVITHNGPEQKSAAQQLQTEQIKKIYDIGVGRYDVTISVGPSYQTKRQEAVATQLDLVGKLPPQVTQNIMDLVVRNMDIPQSSEIADRLKRMIPPQIVGGDEDDPQVQMQKMQATLKEMSQQHELLTKALQEAQKVIETKQVEQQGKVQITQVQEQSKQMIVKMQETTKLAVAQINASKDLDKTFAQAEIDRYDLLHGAAHELALQNDQQAHEREQAMQQQAAAAQSQQADQAHEADMTAAGQQHEAEMAAAAQQGENGNG